MTLEKRAAEALRKGECHKKPCPSKANALKRIESGKADAMSVDPYSMGEVTLMNHFAIRFHDRTLGAAVRKLTLRGFGRGSND